MLRRGLPVVAGLIATVLLSACSSGGNNDPSTVAAPPAASTTVTVAAGVATTTTSTTTSARPTIEGVQTYVVDAAGHSNEPQTYPQAPPVGGTHNPVWQPCTFYDQPVQIEKAVHSLEHGAIWITYRPDLPAAEITTLATLARGRKDVVVSRWDSGLPSPLVVSSWGRQLYLQSATDARLAEFVRQYTNKGPELNAPC